MLLAALIGAIAALVATGGGDVFKKLAKLWRAALRKHVKDESARAHALEIVEVFEADAKEFTVRTRRSPS